MAVEAGRTAGGRDEGARYSIDERPAPTVTPIVFVGGTGRSGTHVVARLLGRNGKLAMIPVECRFHVEMRGFPGLLAGRVRKSHFLRRLHGFWWKGFQNGRQRGLFRFVDPRDFTAAVASFDLHFEAAPEEACRQLFLDLLWPRAVTKGASGIVEQSCDVVARAPTLLRLFPEARFVHVVRDGRDASASRVAQTRGLIPPRNRVRASSGGSSGSFAIDRGARAIPPERLLQVGLEDLLTPPRRPPAGGAGALRRRPPRQQDAPLPLGPDDRGGRQHRTLAGGPLRGGARPDRRSLPRRLSTASRPRGSRACRSSGARWSGRRHERRRHRGRGLHRLPAGRAAAGGRARRSSGSIGSRRPTTRR